MEGRYPFSPWMYAQHIRRNESYVNLSVGATKQILAANPKRIGAVISPPAIAAGANVDNNAAANNVDTSTTGIKLTKTSSLAFLSTFQGATFQETTGTGVVADLELVRSGVTYKLGRYTTSGQYNNNLQLHLGDTVQWNVTTPIGASTSDFTLWIAQTTGLNRITLSVNNPVADGNGILLYANTPPLLLWKDAIGDALCEDLYGLCSVQGGIIGVWDLFY